MPSPPTDAPLGLLEIFGLSPVHVAIPALRTTLFGSGKARPTRWGLSSVRIFKPAIGLPTWAGRVRPDRRVPIYNYFNRRPRPPGEPYSVRVVDCEDYRGGQFTYDSHNGTDFACPVGTIVVAAAKGRVVRVGNDLDMGGLKVCIDHGEGLFTTSNHLSRALVAEGTTVERGAPIGLSGASGLEFVLAFPWVAPHLHFNVWLDANPVDPFAAPGETSLFRVHNAPRPHDGARVAEDDAFVPSTFDPAGVEAHVEACLDENVRAELSRIPSLDRRAIEVMILRNYKPDLFSSTPALYASRHTRRPVLDLPFRAADFVGIHEPPR